MPKPIIVVFANCHNKTALGDFKTAGSIAVELAHELEGTVGISTTAVKPEIFLVTTRDRLADYEVLYGKADDGVISYQGCRFTIAAIEDITPREHNIIAFIEANRCEYAASKDLARIITPETRMLQVLGPHQPDVGANPWIKDCYRQESLLKRQSDIYSFYPNCFVAALGLGSGGTRLGLPGEVPAEATSVALDVDELSPLPNFIQGNYAFAYFAGSFGSKATRTKLVRQFSELTGGDVTLVGEYAPAVKAAARGFAVSGYQVSCTVNGGNKTLLEVTGAMFLDESKELWHTDKLAHRQFEHLMLNSGEIVGVTGVGSIIEALTNGKIPFRQQAQVNDGFAEDYLQQLARRFVATALPATVRKKALEFATKLMSAPMSDSALIRAKALAAEVGVKEALIGVNPLIIREAHCGRVARQLLSFIESPVDADRAQRQLYAALRSVKKPQDNSLPGYEQALRRAANKGDLLAVKVLLANRDVVGLDVNGCVKAGCTPLYFAVGKGHPGVVRLLLDADAALDIETYDGRFLIDIAQGDCKSLLEAATFLNQYRLTRDTKIPTAGQALRRAANAGDVDEVMTILDKSTLLNLDINDAIEKTGMTALHFAALRGYPDVVERLLENGADVEVVNSKGQTPLDLAKDIGTVQLLAPEVVDVNDALDLDSEAPGEVDAPPLVGASLLVDAPPLVFYRDYGSEESDDEESETKPSITC